MREKNDGQEGIEYDTKTYIVTISLSDKNFFDLSADQYYSVKGSDSNYYVSKRRGESDFPVYGIYPYGANPSTAGSAAAYTELTDPDTATLAAYVHTNRYGSDLADNLRKLIYYFEIHSLSASEKSAYLFAATTPYYTMYDAQLDEIYSGTIPDDYHLVLFVPEGYTAHSSSQLQPLLVSGKRRFVKHW